MIFGGWGLSVNMKSTCVLQPPYTHSLKVILYNIFGASAFDYDGHIRPGVEFSTHDVVGVQKVLDFGALWISDFQS